MHAEPRLAPELLPRRGTGTGTPWTHVRRETLGCANPGSELDKRGVSWGIIVADSWPQGLAEPAQSS